MPSRGVLFCRGPSHLGGNTRRGSGRNHSGGITLWGRRAVAGWVPFRVVSPTGGVYRVWSTPTGGTSLVVSAGGLTFWTRRGRPRRGTYFATSWGPLPGRPGWTTLLRWTAVGGVVSEVARAGRARGVSLKVLRHRRGRSEVRYPSRCTSWLDSNTLATAGGVAHPGWKHLTLHKAGDTWARGGRPRVRGVAMNPVDHPHGGGQGKTSGGRPGVSPWGRLTKGKPTRR